MEEMNTLYTFWKIKFLPELDTLIFIAESNSLHKKAMCYRHESPNYNVPVRSYKMLNYLTGGYEHIAGANFIDSMALN